MTEIPSEIRAESYNNVAQDDAQVDAQIGVVHGDVTFYKISGEAAPVDKYHVGRRYLAGNMPRQAEKLIREAFVNGYRSSEVSYYWALSVLSGRSFDHLGDGEFDQLSEAFATTARFRPDEWSTALGVITSLIQSLAVQEQQRDADARAFNIALAGYGRLRAERRDEIRRHLEMVLVGGIQDQIEMRDAAEVAQKRMANNRQSRVWKFFEPKPVGPRPLPPPAREPWTRDLTEIVCGAGLALMTIFLGGTLLVGQHVLLLLGSALLYFGGAFLVMRYGLAQRARAARSKWVDGRFDIGSAIPSPRESGSASAAVRVSGFAADVGRTVDRRFAACESRRTRAPPPGWRTPRGCAPRSSERSSSSTATVSRCLRCDRSNG